MRTLQRIKKSAVGLFAALLLSFISIVAITPSQAVLAQNPQNQVCDAIGNKKCDGGAKKITDTIKSVINLLSAIGGIIAVILIIVGGVKYMTSGGDSNSAANARNTVLYAIIGLIIVAFAQVIVRFVLQQV